MLLPQTLRYADRERFHYGYGYFLPHKDAVAGDLRALGAEVRCFNARGNAQILGSARRVVRALREWKADVVHCHLPAVATVGRIAGKLAGVPVVYTEHNTLDHYPALMRRVHLATWRWQQHVFAVSFDVANSIRRRVGCFPPVEVIWNGVDEEHFDPALLSRTESREMLGLPPESPVVGTVAVFREQKRLSDWLAAAHDIRSRRPDTRFLLVGDGPTRNDLERLTSELGLRDAVLFTGLVEDVRPALSAMDVYLMSSEFEGLPVALLEAMAMGRPVVSTAVGGVKEAVVDGESGVLVTALDPDLLAQAVEKLLDSRRERTRLGAEARARVQNHFSLQSMTRSLETAYLGLVDGRSGIDSRAELAVG